MREPAERLCDIPEAVAGVERRGGRGKAAFERHEPLQ